jgi:hypothetical protein
LRRIIGKPEGKSFNDFYHYIEKFANRIEDEEEEDWAELILSLKPDFVAVSTVWVALDSTNSSTFC